MHSTKNKFTNFFSKFYWRRSKKKIHASDWTLQLNNPQLQVPNNKISTNIYNVFNFVPKSLALQFSRMVNVYFLIIGLLQIIPAISTTDGVPVILLPLSLIIVFASIKEIIEDYKRHKSDWMENNKKILVFKNGAFVSSKWEDLRVGHIIKVQENEPIPADMLLLNTSLKKGLCYIETKNLDGETNLKYKYAHKDLLSLTKIEEELGELNNTLKYEPPNEYLYKFNGCILTQSGEIPLSEQNFVLRGCFLKNTSYAIGVVCYTGHFTKVMLNSANSKAKLSRLERDMGRQIMLIFVILILFCSFSAFYAATWTTIHDVDIRYVDPYGKHPEQRNYASNLFISIGSWVLLLSKYVPISLIVNVEFCRLIQAFLITKDPGMKQAVLNLPATVQSPSLTEELGQIEYILSDKTGTLTKNIMDFKKISIAGELYGNDNSFDQYQGKRTPNVDFYDQNLVQELNNPNMPNHSAVKECITLLAVCHTAVVQEKEGVKSFNAASPDELALVYFAKSVGFEFEGLDEENNITVKHLEKSLNFKLLQVFDFTSDRKRMSVIIKTSEDKILLYTKGADAVLIERMDRFDMGNVSNIKTSEHHIYQFATEGLRTLVLGKRELDSEMYENWLKRYEAAKLKVSGREQEMDQLQSEIERELKFVGVTAIDDKLQDEVGSTIAKFREAGIKVWMLTGDKVETAINIGYSCQLLDQSIKHLLLTQKTHKEVAEHIEAMLEEIQAKQAKKKNFSLIISGDALVHAISTELSGKLMKIAKNCQTLIACRVSPKQKQQFVTLIKKDNPRASTLAIGDGANDVYMITAANVGVGIRGLEGQQAARASDFAIGEFKLLRRLLYYHGRENYRRNSCLIMYNFYKNIALVTSYFWFGFFSCFSGTAFIEKFLLQLFNTLFTSVPIILYSAIDSEFPVEVLVNKPTLYIQGIKNQLFNKTKFFKWAFLGIWESAVVSIYAIMVYDRNFTEAENGQFTGLYGPGMFIFSAVVWIVNLKIFAMSHTFNFLVFFFVIGCTLSYKVCFVIAASIKSSQVYGFIGHFFLNQSFYIGMAAVILATLMPTVAYHSYYALERIHKVPAKANVSIGATIDQNEIEIKEINKDETPQSPKMKETFEFSDLKDKI